MALAINLSNKSKLSLKNNLSFKNDFYSAFLRFVTRSVKSTKTVILKVAQRREESHCFRSNNLGFLKRAASARQRNNGFLA
jgi:hypothetical protein